MKGKESSAEYRGEKTSLVPVKSKSELTSSVAAGDTVEIMSLLKAFHYPWLFPGLYTHSYFYLFYKTRIRYSENIKAMFHQKSISSHMEILDHDCIVEI